MKSKALLFFIFVLTSPILLTAQLSHFIYLQTEAKQPFYAKIDKKILSSSASGYLIVPKLLEGGYSITIGFPKDEIAEQTFICKISSTDAGYLVKNFGEKGWGLFNLQTLDVVMANLDNPVYGKTNVEDKKDEFSTMLAEAVNDPSIKQQPIKKIETIEVRELPITDEKPPVSLPSIKSGVIKNKEGHTGAGFEAEYFDIIGDLQDTISIFIPVEETESNNNNNNLSTEKLQTAEKTDSASLLSKEREPSSAEQHNTNEEKIGKEVNRETISDEKAAATEDKKFLPIQMEAAPVTDTHTQQDKNKIIQMVNSDCKAFASEEDFLKLRKKMASEATDDEMISVAIKFFKSKCYTTQQVKNLCVLFLKDAGKYKFFDTAYAYVSDSYNFHSLEDQLSDSYYIIRFKAMVNH